MSETHKLEWIQRLKKEFYLNFCRIQDVQVSNISELDMRGCWCNEDFEFDFVAATGRSGGLLNIWDCNQFSKVISIWLFYSHGWLLETHPRRDHICQCLLCKHLLKREHYGRSF